MSDEQRFLDRLAERNAQRGDEPTWIAARRQAGAARFEALGFPHRRIEEWKYTDVRDIARSDFALATDAEFSPATAAALTLPLDAYRLTFVDGVFAPALSDLARCPKACRCCPCREPGREPRGRGWTTRPPHRRRFLVLRGPQYRLHGRGRGGTTGTANRGGQADRAAIPVPGRGAGGDESSAHPGRGRRAQRGHPDRAPRGEDGAANFTNLVEEIILERGAILTHYKLQEAPLKDRHIASIHIEQARDSRYVSFNLNLGGGLVRNDLVSDLNGEGAEAIYNGLFYGQGRQHVDNHTLVNHNAPRTFSRENYKGILDDRAHGVFNGKVIVKRDSQQIEPSRATPTCCFPTVPRSTPSRSSRSTPMTSSAPMVRPPASSTKRPSMPSHTWHR